MVVGYKRVSALDQADLWQLDGVATDKLLTEKASGKDTNRPQLTVMLSGAAVRMDELRCEGKVAQPLWASIERQNSLLLHL